MGCDIHLYAEKKVNGKWESADTLSKNKYYEEDPENEQEFSLDYKDAYYSGRNYNLFGILADVRNGRGFAGVKTGEGFNPISEPKGTPEQVSDFVKAELDRWSDDGHSHSYLTVSELMAYDWTQTTTIKTVVDIATYAHWSLYGKKSGDYPEWSCSYTSAETINESDYIKTVNTLTKNNFTENDYNVRNAMQAHFKKNKEAGLPSLHVASSFESPYYKVSGSFLAETLPRLWKLGKPEDVRIVFWFDN
jgi:hypothetical protein